MARAAVRILLIDDDEGGYFLIRDLLTDRPSFEFELDWLADPDVGLETIYAQEHDLFLVDHQLRPADGISLLRAATDRGCAAPMILLTGHAARAVARGAIEAGATDVLEKERLDVWLMERAIRYALRMKQLAEEFERRGREGSAALALANNTLPGERAP